jgi:hypothetical protein
MELSCFNLSRLIGTRIANAFKRAFDELFTLLSDVMIDGGHRLNRAGCWTREGEFAICDLALVQRKRPVPEYHETAVRKLATFVFMEIEYNFFVGELVFGDLHRVFFWGVMDFKESQPSKNQAAGSGR